jgi:hypothetical protein
LEKMLDEYPGYGKHVGLYPGERADRARIEELTSGSSRARRDPDSAGQNQRSLAAATFGGASGPA